MSYSNTCTSTFPKYWHTRIQNIVIIFQTGNPFDPRSFWEIRLKRCDGFPLRSRGSPHLKVSPRRFVHRVGCCRKHVCSSVLLHLFSSDGDREPRQRLATGVPLPDLGRPLHPAGRGRRRWTCSTILTHLKYTITKSCNTYNTIMAGVWGFSQAETFYHPSIEHCPPSPSKVPAGQTNKRRAVLLARSRGHPTHIFRRARVCCKHSF